MSKSFLTLGVYRENRWKLWWFCANVIHQCNNSKNDFQKQEISANEYMKIYNEKVLAVIKLPFEKYLPLNDHYSPQILFKFTSFNHIWAAETYRG